MTLQAVYAENGFKKFEDLLIDASATSSSDMVDVLSATAGSWQVVWSSIVGAAPVIEVQASHDGGVHWDTIAGSSFTAAGATGSTGGVMAQLPGQFMRLKITSAATSGNVAWYLITQEDI